LIPDFFRRYLSPFVPGILFLPEPSDKFVFEIRFGYLCPKNGRRCAGLDALPDMIG